jgi:diadenosine tetraphosphate (Ap4A) HIT family hydrolase
VDAGFFIAGKRFTVQRKLPPGMRKPMSEFTLDKRLQNDCRLMGELQDSLLLLMDNAHYPWFILVPKTRETEFYQLERESQSVLLDGINGLSDFIQSHFSVDKLNVATIGNVVSQLHIHVVGRYHSDPCWPGVVWGGEAKQSYTADAVTGMKVKLAAFFGEKLALAKAE